MTKTIEDWIADRLRSAAGFLCDMDFQVEKSGDNPIDFCCDVLTSDDDYGHMLYIESVTKKGQDNTDFFIRLEFNGEGIAWEAPLFKAPGADYVNINSIRRLCHYCTSPVKHRHKRQFMDKVVRLMGPRINDDLD